MAEIHIEAKAKLPQLAASYIRDQISSTLTRNKHCFCALSGGSSPKGLLMELASMTLPWHRITFSMVDERFTTDPTQQNQSMLSEFIDSLPEPRSKLLTLLTNESLNHTLAAANAAADQLPDSLDLVVLGMGLDGHTASLFPDSTDYQAAMHDTARYVKVVPGDAPYPRISMSYHWLLQARQLVLYIPGKEKLDCFRRLISDPAAMSPVKSLATHANNLIVFSSED